MQRINQYMAEKNLASRREADELISSEKVLVNGKKAVLGQKIDPTKDKVEILGKRQSYVYYAYNKPIGIVTTTPQKGEKDILQVTKFKEKVFPIGRLDKDSHGLIIMTNDRRLTKKILESEQKFPKEYVVRTNQKVTEEFIDYLKQGVTLDDGKKTKPAKVGKIGPQIFSIIIIEGRNRQIRKMVESYKGYEVTDLKRIRIGAIHLKDIKPGTYKEIATKVIEKLF